MKKRKFQPDITWRHWSGGWCRQILAENRCSNDFRIIHAMSRENEQWKHRPLCFRGRSTQWHYDQACGIIGSTGNQYGGRKKKQENRGRRSKSSYVMWNSKLSRALARIIAGRQNRMILLSQKWRRKTDHETGSSYKSTYYKGRKTIPTATHGFSITPRRVEHWPTSKCARVV